MRTLYTGTRCPYPHYVHTPLIELAALPDNGPLHAAIGALRPTDVLLFTSRFAVRFWHEAMQQIGAAWQGQRIVSIGPVTTQALLETGAQGVEQTAKDDSYGVVEHFRTHVPHGCRVVCPRSELALDLIPDGLRAAGFDFRPVTAYRNKMPDTPTKVNLDEIDRIVFTSPSTVDNFIRLYGALPADKQLIARGAITRQHINTIRYEKI